MYFDDDDDEGRDKWKEASQSSSSALDTSNGVSRSMFTEMIDRAGVQ